MIMRISSYSEGGDAMFNAWTLARNHHCILREGCPSYVDANIYFPNKDTMLYSETQLSAGILTLPLYFINQNPIFTYNIWTIISFFLSGWFMYLLAKRLSKGNELVSVMAALVFEFAPLKIAAISHLQNLSIFYLPLVFLLLLKYLDTRLRKYLGVLFIVLVLQFYASWYQMVFVLIALFVFMGWAIIAKLARPKYLLLVGLVICLAVATTLPLAREYTRFSKANQAKFSIRDQAHYASDLADYVIPSSGTLAGKLYYSLKPMSQRNAFNPDSYSYHGLVLYAVGTGVVIAAFITRRKSRQYAVHYKYAAMFGMLFIVGLIVSLGPLLKFKGQYPQVFIEGTNSVPIPMPYIAVDVLLPQLSFIRAIGRASVLCLFALCGILALLPAATQKRRLSPRFRLASITVVSALIVFELLPIHRVGMTGHAYSHNLSIPKVYKLIRSDRDIDNLVILAADKDYPGATIPVARAEQVLWAGYHNKNIFNGYSGYTPQNYFSDLDDFTDFSDDDVPKMKARGLRYVLVDKLLSSTQPNLNARIHKTLTEKTYEDERYALYKI